VREIGVKDLKNDASRVIDDVAGGARYVVTKRGRPTALIMSMDDAEDFVLAHAEEFVAMRREGRTAHRAGRSESLT
jgi:prevent-host-death family protein